MESEGGSEVTAERGTLGFSRETDARECVRASEVQLQKSLGVCLTQRSARRRLAWTSRGVRRAGTGV